MAKAPKSPTHKIKRAVAQTTRKSQPGKGPIRTIVVRGHTTTVKKKY